MAKKPKLDGLYGKKQLDLYAERNWGEDRYFNASAMEPDKPRLSSGIFPLDFALAGGFPLGSVSVLYGPYSSGKSAALMSTLGQASRFCFECIKPDVVCTCKKPTHKSSFLILTEATDFDRTWAEDCGAPSDSYVIGVPESGEQGLEMLEMAIRTRDIGFVGLDSLAMLTSTAIIERSMIDQEMGIEAKMLKRGLKKANVALQIRKTSHLPIAVVLTNQVIADLKVKFGNPEIMAGGNAVKFIGGAIVRCGQIKLKDKHKNKYVPDDDDEGAVVASLFNFKLIKKRLFALRSNGEYIRVEWDLPGLRLKKGQVDDFDTTYLYATEVGVVKGAGANVVFDGKKFKGKNHLLRHWMEDKTSYERAKWQTIEAMKQKVKEKTYASQM